MPSIPAKTIKLTVAVPVEVFPIDLAPPPGTPGGKTAIIPLEVDYGTGVLTTSVKGASLQKAAASVAANPGGFIVMTGKLSKGNTIIETGIAHQPPKPPTVTPTEDAV
ncbi:hypothetical protein CCP2SC5_420013 [Azospirillaceae bacterium]